MSKKNKETTTTELLNTAVAPVPIGSMRIDCTPLAPYLEDLPAGALVGKHGAQDGFELALQEIISNQSLWGPIVGIGAEEVLDIQLANQRVAMIDAYLPAARKIVEILEESRGKHDHRRHRGVCEIAALVEVRGTSRPESELMARYEKTRAYRSAVAMKAAKTRRQNEAAEAAAEELAAEATATPAEAAATPAEASN